MCDPQLQMIRIGLYYETTYTMKYVCTCMMWLTPITGHGYLVCQEAGQDPLVSTWIYHMNIRAHESCSPTLIVGTLVSSSYKHTYIRSLQ